MDDTEKAERERVVAVARTWLRTPYHDCAHVKGSGVDCAYLLKCVFEEAGIESPIDIPAYSPQWFLHRSEELYMDRVLERSVQIEEAAAQPGDLVLYKFGRCFAHGAIIVDPGWPAIIHAYKQAGCVTTGIGTQTALAWEGVGRPRERRFYTRRAWQHG